MRRDILSVTKKDTLLDADEGLRDDEEDFCDSEEQLGDGMMLFVTKREGY